LSSISQTKLTTNWTAARKLRTVFSWRVAIAGTARARLMEIADLHETLTHKIKIRSRLVP